MDNNDNRIFIIGINDIAINQISKFRYNNITFDKKFNSILGFAP